MLRSVTRKVARANVLQSSVALKPLGTSSFVVRFSSTSAPAAKPEPIENFTSHDGNFEQNVTSGIDAAGARTSHYLVVGGARALYASASRLAVLKFVGALQPTADVLAVGSVEIDTAKIPLGTSLTIKWRGKPVFVRHRTPKEIEQATADDTASNLRDVQTDAERRQKAEFLVVLGVCTHLGCVPLPNSGNYNGWFCPCHGSHYDLSGRIRKGPAPTNLEVPPYKYLNDTTILIG